MSLETTLDADAAAPGASSDAGLFGAPTMPPIVEQMCEDEELSKASIVTSGYGASGETLGGLGVLGPTYMDYPGTMRKVAAVAHYISNILGEEGG